MCWTSSAVCTADSKIFRALDKRKAMDSMNFMYSSGAMPRTISKFAQPSRMAPDTLEDAIAQSKQAGGHGRQGRQEELTEHLDVLLCVRRQGWQPVGAKRGL